MKRDEKNNKNNERRALYRDLIIVALSLFISINLVAGVVGPYVEAKDEQASLEKDIKKAENKKEELSTSLDESENSDEMEKGYIRERFHMSNKDELIFVFPEES